MEAAQGAIAQRDAQIAVLQAQLVGTQEEIKQQKILGELRDDLIVGRDNLISQQRERLEMQENLISQLRRSLQQMPQQGGQQPDFELQALRKIAKIKQPQSAPEPAAALDGDDAAALRNLLAMEISWIADHQKSKEQELANLDKGRPASTEEGKAKKERRKAELQAEIADLSQQCDRYQALLKKLEI